jgi:LacI family transcriptional regulator
MSLMDKLIRIILSDYVENGKLSPGDQFPTTRELAEQYGASVASIAHALGILQAQGIVDKRRSAGCFLVRSTAAPAYATAGILGLVIPAAPEARILAHFSDGVEEASRAMGLNLLYLTHKYDYEREREQVHRALEAECQAIILCPNARTQRQFETDYLRRDTFDVPLVLVDMCQPDQGHIQVVFDNFQAGRDMAEWLLHNGHERIAFMRPKTDGTDLAYRSVDDRFRGYLAALEARGIIPRAEWAWDVDISLRGDPDEAVAHAIVRLAQWRETPDRVTAVMALEDNYAVDYYIASRELQIDVPGELCLTGFDNLPVRRSARPLFATTEADFRHAGALAVDLAMRQRKGIVKPPLTMMLPVPMVFPKEEAFNRTRSALQSHS